MGSTLGILIDSKAEYRTPSPFSSGSDYKIKVQDKDQAWIHDYSDNNFSLTSPTTSNILGDYNNNNELDGVDISTLLNYWNDNKTNENGINIDLAPVTGSPPNFISTPDGVWDLDDLMAFIRNWNYYNASMAREKNAFTADSGLPGRLEIINNQLMMQLPKFNESISSIWFQLSLPSSESGFSVADFGHLFDITLESNVGESIYVWDLAKLGNGIDLLSLPLGTINLQNKEKNTHNIQLSALQH